MISRSSDLVPTRMKGTREVDKAFHHLDAANNEPGATSEKHIIKISTCEKLSGGVKLSVSCPNFCNIKIK